MDAISMIAIQQTAIRFNQAIDSSTVFLFFEKNIKYRQMPATQPAVTDEIPAMDLYRVFIIPLAFVKISLPSVACICTTAMLPSSMTPSRRIAAAFILFFWTHSLCMVRLHL